ncbi:DUF2946 family protein [Pseudomonas monteilii]
MIVRARLHICLFACFAVLFNLLAMPLERAFQARTFNAQSLILGSFCSLHGIESIPQSVLAQLKIDLPQFDDQHSTKHKQGDCCCGHAGHALLTSDYYRHLFPRYWPDALLLGDSHRLPLPREQWPKLNPRASPLV